MKKNNFQEVVDRRRPRRLLTTNPLRTFRLEYEYTDTGETVCVPNIWYNQTDDMLADSWLFDAERYIERAEVLSTTPPDDVDATTIAETIADYTKQAKVYRQNARFVRMGCSLSIY